MLYAAKSDESARAQATQVAGRQVRDAIDHLETRDQNPAALTDLKLQYTLGLLYTRSGQVDKAIQRALARRQREPAIRAGPSRSRSGVLGGQGHRTARSRRSRKSSTTSRASQHARTVCRSRPAVRKRRRSRTRRRSRWHRTAASSKCGGLPPSSPRKTTRPPPTSRARRRRSTRTICAFRSSARTRCCRWATRLARSPSLEPVARGNPNDAATQLSLADLYSNGRAKERRGADGTAARHARAGQRRRVELPRLPARGSRAAARRSDSPCAPGTRHRAEQSRTISTALAGRISVAAIYDQAERYLAPAAAADAAQFHRPGPYG